MIVIGIDPHQASHTASVVDARTGELLSELPPWRRRERTEVRRALAWVRRDLAHHEADLRAAEVQLGDPSRTAPHPD